MSNPSISSIFTNYFHQCSPAPLQITFATLAIRNHQNGQFLNQVERRQSRIVLQKMSSGRLAKINVLDNMVFRFSFQFRLFGAGNFHDMEMLSLPRPLDSGMFGVDKEKLWLSFRIDAPDPSLRVQVVHTYQNICKLEAFSEPLCGQTF